MVINQWLQDVIVAIATEFPDVEKYIHKYVRSGKVMQ